MEISQIILDYGPAASADLLANLSAVAAAGRVLWTASDEGRSVEVLAPDGDGYRLAAQLRLDELFPGLPDGEADIESMDCDGERLWICGSNCKVRSRPVHGDFSPELRTRDSRRLFGSARISGDGSALKAPGKAAAFSGAGSLRRALQQDPFLAPFLELPSKEGGVDIEGLAVAGGRALIGLRGPTIDSCAVIAEVRVGSSLQPGPPMRHFVDLGGLGVRDLTRLGEDILILAGPTNAAKGPFGVFRWRPAVSGKAQSAALLFDLGLSAEYPEGLCPLERGGRPGLILLHDTPDGGRISGSCYTADWLALS